jgi:hypothetical protein
MTSNPDRFSLRVAAALVKQEQQQQPGGFVVRRTPKSGLGALRDLFHSIARPDEREPAAIIIGLDCSDPNAQTVLQRDMSTDARDVLLLYEDHVLLIGNPVRGAGLGTLVKLFAGGFNKQGKVRNTPHSRLEQADIGVAELVVGRPSWGTNERFVHLVTNPREIWFWVDLPVDSEDSVTTPLDILNKGKAHDG